MDCPCGNRKIEPAEVRRWMASNQEARMAARVVAKADTFGGDLTPCEVDGRRGVWVGPQPEVVEAEVDDRDDGGAVVGWIRKAIAKARGEQ